MNFKKYLTYSLVVGSLTSVTYTSFSDYGIIKNSQVHAAQVGNVQVSNWAKPYVEAMKDGGLLPVSLQSGNLAQNITREEFAELITTYVNKAGKKYSPNKNATFSDSQNPLIKEAAKLGIVQGFPDGTFKPTKQITREQMATMTFRGEEITSLLGSSANVSKFKDGKSVSNWARAGVGAMSDIGAIEGFTDGTFKPKNQATRQQAIKIVAELADKKGAIKINRNSITKPKPVEQKPSVSSGLKTSGFRYSNLTLSGNVGETYHGLKIPTEMAGGIGSKQERITSTGYVISHVQPSIQSNKGDKRYELSWALTESMLKSIVSEGKANEILDYSAKKNSPYETLEEKIFNENGYIIEVKSPLNRSIVDIKIRKP